MTQVSIVAKQVDSPVETLRQQSDRIGETRVQELTETTHVDEGAKTGAAAGGAVGGLTGLLVGLVAAFSNCRVCDRCG